FREVAGNWRSEAELATRAQQLRAELSIAALLITRAEEGMSLFTDAGALHIPAQSREVFDVSGAGDTVIATLGALLGAHVELATVEARVDPRSPTGLEEFDRVLGGGLVPGAVVLLGGDPGIGKSTLLLQAMAAIGAAKRTLYVTGEESAEQIAMRARRLGLVNAPVELQAEVQLEAIVAAIRSRQPEGVVIDSIQTVYTEALESAPGSVGEVP